MRKTIVGKVYEEDFIPLHLKEIHKEATRQYVANGCYLSIDVPNETIYIVIDSNITLYEYMQRRLLLIPCMYKGVRLRPTRRPFEDF